MSKMFYEIDSWGLYCKTLPIQGILTDDVESLYFLLSLTFISWDKHTSLLQNLYMRKDCFQNKSKFITEDHFTKHMNITIC